MHLDERARRVEDHLLYYRAGGPIVLVEAINTGNWYDRVS